MYVEFLVVFGVVVIVVFVLSLVGWSVGYFDKKKIGTKKIIIEVFFFYYIIMIWRNKLINSGGVEGFGRKGIRF